ncbi:hypothetical protein DFH05DRAFT_1456785 [Lentinula detonsa]|uniref:Uncharacterized protein n=1 Tax=Lentinula detonsa TaxID=2804962 RepID=A0A9W8P828_9AGAR|nr:hypothetical protein DFH05DRAFT_1456785 [Lentinula detonsa]
MTYFREREMRPSLTLELINVDNQKDRGHMFGRTLSNRMVKSSSKLKSHRDSGSRRVQQYGGGSTNLVELMKSTIHKVNRTQITGLKAKQEALKSNEQFWSERQDWDGEGFSDSVDEDMERVADVLEGWTTMDHSNAGDWEDITGDFWRTEMGKRKYKEYRTQRDRTERRNKRFAMQVEPMTGAYMTWYGTLGDEGVGGGLPGELSSEANSQTVIAVDIFREIFLLRNSNLRRHRSLLVMQPCP